jgi:hypothetical protein
MPAQRDWTQNRDAWIRILERRTGEGVATWNRRIARERLTSRERLRSWLAERGVTGYARSLLEMETFGYPDFLVTRGDALIDAQYEDRPSLRPIYDALIAEATTVGELVIQARKTYVSLVARRTFARVQATTKTRVDLALRLVQQTPGGRLVRSRIHETMPVQVGLTSPADLDSEVRGWLRRAYEEND